ncbi:MAG: hypothetical protein MUF49_02110 [Oculatellaceae cyanobacterium Prado106]|jgi:uncharacterized protein (DUF3084 family)|nr:hypothetical protein [Oculatellaceae cyanobacterium Prado106]
MRSKGELQNLLKEQYGVNKNISQDLTAEECLNLLQVLGQEPSAVKLVEAFSQKNASLGYKNSFFSRMRNNAEKKLEATKAEYRQLEASIQDIEASKQALMARKEQLEQETASLASEVKTLSDRNTELVNVNDQLKKDNKQLKNIVDAIRLRLAHDTNELLKYEDNELQKALIRLFRWTLG